MSVVDQSGFIQILQVSVEQDYNFVLTLTHELFSTLKYCLNDIQNKRFDMYKKYSAKKDVYHQSNENKMSRSPSMYYFVHSS